MKEQKGITLIALVITIIVLLILAGVSIAMLTGENGILTKATTAKRESQAAEVAEACKLGLAELQADMMDPTISTANKPIVSAASIAQKAMSNNSSLKATEGKTNDSTAIAEGATATIYLTLNNVDYVVTYKAAKKETTSTGEDGTTTTVPAEPATITAAEAKTQEGAGD